MGTKAVHDTAFYPQPMVHRIVQIWKKQWYHDRHSALVQQAFVLHTTDQKLLEEQQACQDLCHQFAFPAQHEKDNEQESSTLQEEETVTSEVRERARAMLHRLHRAAGHPGNQNLARLCRDRKLPSWVVQEAKNLKCPTCVETQRGGVNIIQRSMGESFLPWQFVVMDVFELAFPTQRIKARFLLMACATMHFMSIICLAKTSMSAAGTDSGEKIITAFCDGWLMHVQDHNG